MLKECQLVSIFCEIDDFCKELDKNMPQPVCGLQIFLRQNHHIALSLVCYKLAYLSA